jgi:hypothetical protein
MATSPGLAVSYGIPTSVNCSIQDIETLITLVHNEATEAKDSTFMILSTWISDSGTGLSGSAIVEDLKTRTHTFGEPFRSVLQSIPSEAPFWHNRLTSWPTQPWDNRNGTVTLAGDAAHPMTFRKFPFICSHRLINYLTPSMSDRGQGLNQTITDAAFFGRQLAALDNKSPEALSAVVTAYEKELWERGNEAVLGSTVNSLSVHNWEELKSSPLFTAGVKPGSSTPNNSKL